MSKAFINALCLVEWEVLSTLSLALDPKASALDPKAPLPLTTTTTTMRQVHFPISPEASCTGPPRPSVGTPTPAQSAP